MDCSASMLGLIKNKIFVHHHFDMHIRDREIVARGLEVKVTHIH